MRVSVIVPLKNEAKNIPILTNEFIEVTGMKTEQEMTEVLFVDDHSEDDTSQQIKQSSAHLSILRGISLEGVTGKGAAIKVGIREAKGDVLVTMDGDCQHSPLWVVELAKPIVEDHSDIVVAATSEESHSLSRKILSKAFNGVFNHLFRLDLCTPNAPKAFRRGSVTGLQVSGNGFDFDMEFLVRAKRAGLRISQVPMVTRKRLYGHSKVYAPKVAFFFLYRLMALWLEKRGVSR